MGGGREKHPPTPPYPQAGRRGLGARVGRWSQRRRERGAEPEWLRMRRGGGPRGGGGRCGAGPREEAGPRSPAHARAGRGPWESRPVRRPPACLLSRAGSTGVRACLCLCARVPVSVCVRAYLCLCVCRVPVFVRAPRACACARAARLCLCARVPVFVRARACVRVCARALVGGPVVEGLNVGGLQLEAARVVVDGQVEAVQLPGGREKAAGGAGD
jgi:hypothetical protein